jgi:ADP-heptose:LPS heptosyltransferase
MKLLAEAIKTQNWEGVVNATYSLKSATFKIRAQARQKIKKGGKP